MCEQTEVHYLEGDVVWVKLGACWWPGRVRDVDKLPDDILESFRKKPIAAVQFFNEDKYEYVKNLDQICRYNCRRKTDFIKKGLDMFRAKQREGSSFMDKFPNDVSMAEQLTDGNPDIVADNAFAPEEKPSYRGIFGGEKKPEKKGKMGGNSPTKGSPSWRSKLGSSSSPKSPLSSPRRPITHPRIIRMLKGEEEQHDVRIRQQPVTPQRETSPQGEPYKCYKCDFTSKRLNVVILHSKSHSGDGATNGQESKHVRSKSASNLTTPHRGRGRPRGSHPGSVGRPPKNSPKVASQNSVDTIESNIPKNLTNTDGNAEENAKDTLPSSEKRSPKIPIFGKRKSSKAAGDKTTKKKKSSEDFREKLLAEWEDEDQEEEEKEMMILKQELSKSEALSSPPPEKSNENVNYSTNKVSPSSNVKPKEISCFDFDEKADSLLDHELEERAKKFAEARKFPRRIDDRIEIERRIENVEITTEEIKYKEVVSPKAVVEMKDNRNDENKDLHKEFENLMAETEVPSLPSVPQVKVSDKESIQVTESSVTDSLEDALEERIKTLGHDFNEKEEEILRQSQGTTESVSDSSGAEQLCKTAEELSADHSFPLPSDSSVDHQAQTSGDLSIEHSNYINKNSNIERSVEPSLDVASDSPVESAQRVEPSPLQSMETNNMHGEIVDEPLPQPTTLHLSQSTSMCDSESVCESQLDPISPVPPQDTVIQQTKGTALAQDLADISFTQPPVQIPIEEPAQISLADETAEICATQRSAGISATQNSAEISLQDHAEICIKQDPTQIPVTQDPVQKSAMHDSVQISDTLDAAQKAVTQVDSQVSVAHELLSVPAVKEQSHMAFTSEQPIKQATTQISSSQESAQIPVSQESTQISVVHEPAQISLEEMDLDINSMPVVMGDTLITDDQSTKLNVSNVVPTNSVAITLPPSVPSEKSSVQPVMRLTAVSAANPSVTPGTVTLNVTPTLELVTEASTSVVKSSAQTTTANSAPKIVKQVVKSLKIQPGPSGTLRTADGSILAPKAGAGGNRYVLIQHSTGKHSLYTTGKSGQQCVTMKTGSSHGQGGQQTIGKKLVIVKSPQGTTVSPEVLSSLQQGLSSGGKIVPQRIITSQGTILKQMGRSTPKLMHVTPQQMKALTGGKQVGGTKLTMQSTPTKVVLPTVQKMVSQGQGVKVMTATATAKSKPNTILIQTTQGTSVGGAIVTRAVTGSATGATTAVHTKLSTVPQTVVRQVGATARSKIVATASPSGSNLQRVVVSTAGRGAVLQGQAQQKVLATRSVQPRMLMQKARGTTAVRVPNVGAIAGIQTQMTPVQQVKKVQGTLPRAQVLQKTKQGQMVQKVVTVQQQQGVAAIKPTSSTEATQSIALPSLQPLQPEISVAPTIQQSLQPSTLVLSSAPTVISQNLITSQNASLPVATSSPLLTHEHIAQVITPTGSEQLGEGGTATYVLVTIDDQGAIQPYDSSGLVTSYDGVNQSTESNTRTLYIDPSSLGSSGDLENIFLAINNTASAASGTLLNLGQTNSASGASISTTQHSQSVFNISDNQPATPGGSQDILAAALANTDVFQSDGTMSDSLTVVNSSQSSSGSVMTSRLLESSSLLPSSTSTTLHQATMLLPSLSSPAMPPPNTAGVLETSLTLNQPIMTPLEVPSSVTTLQQPAPPIPTSLELPLTITQPVLSMPATSPFSGISQQGSLQTQETEAVESPISSSSVSRAASRTSLSTRPTLQPSMPLLSEDVSDSQAAVPAETHADAEILDPSQPGSSFNSAETTSGQDSENVIASATPNSAEQILPSYAQVPEVSSHATEDHDAINSDMNYESNPTNQHLPDQDLSTSYHEVPESTSEVSASVMQEVAEISEMQAASEQTVSTSYARGLQDAVLKDRAEIIDSSIPPATETLVPNYSVENSSEAVAVKDMTGAQEPSRADDTCIPYEQVESTSQLRDGLNEPVTEITQTLPSESCPLQSYTPAPESTSSVSGEVLESNTSGTFSLPSYSQTPESTCELQEEKVVSNQSTSGSYSQVPESTSHMPESRVVGETPMDILDSSQHSLDSSVLTPYQVPESSSEASVVSYEETHGTSGVTPPSSNQTAYTSCSQVPESTSQMHEVLTFSDSSTEVSECAVPMAQSMPLLLDGGTGPVGAKRHLDGSGTDASEDHSKRVKIDETERIKDQVLPPSCPLPTPDILSLQSGDGENIDSNDDYDDLPSPCYPQSACDQKAFKRNDIVWMKVNKLYIPGVVVGTKRKKRVAQVKLINSLCKDKAFRKRFSDLLDFCNNSRNRSLLEEGRKHNPAVQEAFDKITEFWFSNYKAGGTLSAAKYLTYNEDDQLYGLSDLHELYQKEQHEREHDKTDSESENDANDRFSPDPHARALEFHCARDYANSCYSGKYLNSDDLDGHVSTASITEEEQTNSITCKQERMNEEAEKLIDVIKGTACKEHLRHIFNGSVSCERHLLFMRRDLIIQRNLINKAGLGPFSNNMGMKLIACLNAFLLEIDGDNSILNFGSRNDYLFNVIVPEAIIFAVCKVHNLNYEDAERRFRLLSAESI